jgi:hypothetical protein
MDGRFDFDGMEKASMFFPLPRGLGNAMPPGSFVSGAGLGSSSPSVDAQPQYEQVPRAWFHGKLHLAHLFIKSSLRFLAACYLFRFKPVSLNGVKVNARFVKESGKAALINERDWLERTT